MTNVACPYCGHEMVKESPLFEGLWLSWCQDCTFGSEGLEELSMRETLAKSYEVAMARAKAIVRRELARQALELRAHSEEREPIAPRGTTPRPTCIELFAGAGGMMLGLEQAGFRTIVANEIHPDPSQTLRYNFPSTPVITASLRDLCARDLLGASNQFTVVGQEVDLVAGGPPCQGFSTAGLKDPADPRNSLIGEFIRIVREIRPRFFLLENVTGLLTLHRGRLFENVQHELSMLGYRFTHQVLMAAWYGVPQMRKRLIVLGSRDGPPPAHPLPEFGDFSKGDLFSVCSAPYTTCGDAIGDLPPVLPGEEACEFLVPPKTPFQLKMREGAKRIYNHQASKHRQETMNYFSLIPPGGTALDIPVDVRNGKQGIQRWPVDGLSRTITTEPTDFLHPTLNRIPTVRELARVQTFPDRYVFLGQRTTGNKMRRLGYCSQTQQVGNAVPPMLAEAIGRSIYYSASRG